MSYITNDAGKLMMLTSMLDDYIRELEFVYDWEGAAASEKERECKSELDKL